MAASSHVDFSDPGSAEASESGVVRRFARGQAGVMVLQGTVTWGSGASCPRPGKGPSALSST